MSFWKRFFDKKQKIKEPDLPNQTQEIKNKSESLSPAYAAGIIPVSQPLKQETGEHVLEGKSSVQPNPGNRSIRVFVSSTFKDMIEDRNELMTHTWPELRRFCR